ncbi:MAG: biopolymer transporter ExbD [Planctomycetes bacterium]|nr:biopolymer transporter ExbD [Planctomycetota bacterium]
MAKKRHKWKMVLKDEEVDLNPLIDVITMLLVFFIIGGKMSQDVRTEQITVPPTRTASKLDVPKDWELLIVNVFGNTQTPEGTPMAKIRVGKHEWVNRGIDGDQQYAAYIGLRQMLDRVYDAADKYDDPKQTGMRLPKVTLELRCDVDTQYRVVQEIQQIVADSIDPKPTPPQEAMTAKKYTNPAQQAKPFVSINFTSRKPEKD